MTRIKDAVVFSKQIATVAKVLVFCWLITGVSAAPAAPQVIVGGFGFAMVASALLPDRR